MNSLNVAIIGTKFMGKAHSNAWKNAPHFFDMNPGSLPADNVTAFFVHQPDRSSGDIKYISNFRQKNGENLILVCCKSIFIEIVLILGLKQEQLSKRAVK